MPPNNSCVRPWESPFLVEIIELTSRIENCPAGIDDSADNPLARATDCLFRLGRPFSRLSKCFFQGPDGIFRWLGIFVHSAGDRVIFFPGFAQPQMHVTGYNDDVLRWNRSFQIDHLSLEPDRLSWHFTAPRSADHLGRLYTRQLASGVVHWFSMSAQTQENLRVVRENTCVSVLTPSRDVDRRVEVFRRAREGALFQLVRLNASHPYPVEPNFLHFSVVAGPTGFDSPGTELLSVPHGSPFLGQSSYEDLAKVPIRLHRVSLSETIELEITASFLSGELQIPLLFSGQHLPAQ